MPSTEKTARAQEIVRRAVENLDDTADCACHHARAHAILTNPIALRPATARKLQLLAGDYLKASKRC